MILTTSKQVPEVYPALLSHVAAKMRQRLQVGDKVKDGLSYKAAFTGSEAVDAIAYIIKTSDRNLALLLGRALDAQKFFHDVTYDHRLRDYPYEVYQWQDDSFVVYEEKHKMAAMAQSTGVNGIFTLMANCYSPTCTRNQLCYSIYCPNRLEQQARQRMRSSSATPGPAAALSSLRDDDKENKLWIHTVSKEISESIDERERKRQEVVCEVIYTERDFVKDLEYVRDFWIKPLRTQNVIPEHRREKFIRTVFSNVMEVHAINSRLADALTHRQQAAPVVKQIGDIMLEYVPKFVPFIRYGSNQLYGKYEFERERSTNPQFARFVEETERLKESRKLELNGYLTKPTTRLARYPLLLEAVLKHTAPDAADATDLPRAIEQIREFLSKVNIESGRASNRFNLMQLNYSLVFRPGEHVDLKLADEGRQILFKGLLKKKTQDNQGDIQVYLLDNCLLFVRVKIVNKREQLKVHRKPIPLELLVLSQSEEAPSRASLAKRPSSSLIPTTKSSAPSRAESASNKYPMTFQHLGRRGYEITLYATTFVGRKKWVEQIEAQQRVLRERSGIYVENVLCAGFFDGSNRVNCAVPIDGGRKMLYGTDNGIYISDTRTRDGGRPSPPQKTLSVANVTQLDVLEEYSTLLALSDKNLLSWSLDSLDLSDPGSTSKKPKKIVGHVNFFRSGLCLGRLLVCTVKSNSMTSTVRVMEPADSTSRNKKHYQSPAAAAALRKFLQVPAQDAGLKVFREFYIPSESLSISFLKSKLCVGCAKGFELVSLETLETQSLLDPADTSLDFVMRREGLKPISIYRLNGDFLLNYSDFSFFVNRNGWRSRPDWMIHWEGLPQSFALCYPYLLAFEPSFVEIRHVDTGALVNIITGGKDDVGAENVRFLHESISEILYVYEDERGYDVVAWLDFWHGRE
ncbi:CNH domain-containing protein [Dipodascopsis tothii]|uniref:CNH domain-containing protein n=1 Tax=Dipodascopsis tothii TaxID=44089 RepID=UPI0034CFD9C9